MACLLLTCPPFRGNSKHHCSDSFKRVSFCFRRATILCDRLADLAEQILFGGQKLTAREPVDPKFLALLPY